MFLGNMFNGAADQMIIGTLVMHDFETQTATGSEQFCLLTCLYTTTFILLSIFSPLEMISIKICETPLSWHLKCALPVGVRVFKTLVLKLPTDNDNTEGAEILCMRMFGIAQNMVGLIQNNIKQWKTV